ncbi:MAG: hypothetical protein R3C53_17930 [Pirellulaceae bacterium]
MSDVLWAEREDLVEARSLATTPIALRILACGHICQRMQLAELR